MKDCKNYKEYEGRWWKVRNSKYGAPAYLKTSKENTLAYLILSAIEIGVPSPKDLQRARVIPPSSHPPYRPAIHLFSCVRGGRGQLPVECTREQTCWWCALNRWYCGGLVFMRVVCVCAYWVRLDCERRAAAAGCLASYPGPCEVNILTYSTYCISTWFVYLLSSLKKLKKLASL